jgi:Phosphotransferase enzyme family
MPSWIGSGCFWVWTRLSAIGHCHDAESGQGCHSRFMSQPESALFEHGSQPVELTALELHPDGKRLRLTRATYSGSVFYGPALAAAVPGATPIRRLSYEVQAEGGRKAIWLLESDGRGEGWQEPAELPLPSDPTAEVQSWVMQALAPETEGRPHWQRRGGWVAMLAWLDAELHEQGRERLGLPQVLKDWGISFLMRVQTADGPVYLKALPDFFLAEVWVTCTLWRELPGAAAPVLAANTERGLLLLADAGEPLIETCSGWFTPPADAEDWTPEDSAALMQHLARIQRRAEKQPWLGRLPDHGPEWVLGHLPKLLAGPLFRTEKKDGLNPDEVAALLALRPRLESVLEHLIASPIPRTLGHGDLHKGNVLRQGHIFTLLDWSDASLTHPFLDCGPQYLVPEVQRPAAEIVYLQAWTEFLPLPELQSLLQGGLLAGELYRVLGYTENIQPFVYADDWDDDWNGAHLHHFRALLKLAGVQKMPA